MPISIPVVNYSPSCREILDSRQRAAARLRSLAAEATTGAVRRQLEKRALAEERVIQEAAQVENDPG